MLGFLRQREKPVAETWGLKLGDAHKPSERELKENSCVVATHDSQPRHRATAILLVALPPPPPPPPPPPLIVC
jgi:hypothetical protein